MDGKLSRRDVLTRAAVLGAGAVFGGLTTSAAKASEGESLMKEWPWPYEKLDPAVTAEIAYNEWYNLGCGGTVIHSVFEQLAEIVGEPYKSFPVESFAIFEGGMAGWGTICGSVNGASVVAALIVCHHRIKHYGLVFPRKHAAVCSAGSESKQRLHCTDSE